MSEPFSPDSYISDPSWCSPPAPSDDSPSDMPPEDQLPLRMRDAVCRMKLIVPVLSVATLALRRQNAELDEDVATVLDEHASAPLDRLIDELELLLELIAAQRHDRRAAA